MASVSFERAGKVFGDGTVAVSELSLEVDEGEFMVFVGPSGCGKTTALRMVAGLEDITRGNVRIGGRIVNDDAPRDRDIAMVFQSYSLYPHLTVYDNMAFGLKLRRMKKREIADRVIAAAQLLDLEQQLDRKPHALSGGQRQRVAMGRAIVREPRVFLMDEPLSNLDAKLRVQMRSEIARIQSELGVTTIFVTHDQVEAMTMGSRIAVMRKGELQQLGPPRSVYHAPENLFVAGFIGSPPMNFLEAQLVPTGDGFDVDLGNQRLPLDPATALRNRHLRSETGREIVVGIRPEAITEAVGDRETARLAGRVVVSESVGPEVIAHVAVDARRAMTREVREVAGDIGEDRPKARDATLIARFPADSTVRPGDNVELAIDTRGMHFFDPASGVTISSDVA